jgi:hypothetical protein
MIPENKKSLLVNFLLQVMFVGILLGLFRTAVPALSESIFNVPKNSFIFLSTFVIAFGLIKGVSNYYAGIDQRKPYPESPFWKLQLSMCDLDCKTIHIVECNKDHF